MSGWSREVCQGSRNRYGANVYMLVVVTRLYSIGFVGAVMSSKASYRNDRDAIGSALYRPSTARPVVWAKRAWRGAASSAFLNGHVPPWSNRDTCCEQPGY